MKMMIDRREHFIIIVCSSLFLPAAKTFPEFLVSEYPSACLSSASSSDAASWTRNIRQPISIWALPVSVSTFDTDFTYQFNILLSSVAWTHLESVDEQVDNSRPKMIEVCQRDIPVIARHELLDRHVGEVERERQQRLQQVDRAPPQVSAIY